MFGQLASFRLPATARAALPVFERHLGLNLVRALVLSATLSFGVLLLRSTAALPDAVPPLLYLALQSLSLLGLLGALVFAGPRASQGERLLSLLSALEGRGEPSLREQWLITARCLSRLLMLPALVLALAANTAYPIGQLSRTLGLGLGAVVYALALTVGLATLASVARELSPARGRWWLIGVALVPLALSQVWPDVPNLLRVARATLEVCLSPFA